MGQSIKLEAWAGADIPALTRRELDFTKVPVSASAVLRHFDMALVSSFLPQTLHDLRGAASGRAKMEGTWSEPVFSGRLDLSSGEATLVPLLARLKDIEAAIALDRDSIVLERLFMRSGLGTAEASGRLNSKGLSPQTGNARLELRRFPLTRPGLPRSVIDTTVKTLFDASGAETRVKVELSGSSVTVATELERAPASLPTSDSIRFIDTPPEISSTPVAGALQAVSKPLHLTIDIKEPIYISGRGIAMSWGGRLSMRDRNGSPQVEGRITSDRGRFELLGRNFRLERGEITLPSSAVIDPYLDLAASTEVDATRVEAKLRGRLSRPEISFTSDPPLTQPRILALLLTGRADTGEGGDGFDNDKVRTKAASLLVAFSNPALEQRLAPRLHVDRIKVGLGERADEPIVGLGKWLSQKLYVESVYHHNAPSDENRATARVEYHFKPRWSVETYYGDANVGGVDLFWTKKFTMKPSSD
jgi:translocation and assembly module TamB